MNVDWKHTGYKFLLGVGLTALTLLGANLSPSVLNLTVGGIVLAAEDFLRHLIAE